MTSPSIEFWTSAESVFIDGVEHTLGEAAMRVLVEQVWHEKNESGKHAGKFIDCPACSAWYDLELCLMAIDNGW